MKPTKQQEKEIQTVYEAYWESYLKGDMQTMAALMDDGITVIGSAQTEVFFNKQDTMAHYAGTAHQIASAAEFRNRVKQLQLVDGLAHITEQLDFYVLSDGAWIFYAHCRLSTFLQQKEAGWKLVYQHGSMPDTRAGDGEQIGLEKITKENLELRDAVKRRTVELENKNRELEMETALEKVRSVAMAMRKPADLLSICQVLFEALHTLGFGECRNAMINIHHDDKNYLLNYDYALATAGTVTNIPYNFHPFVDKQIKVTRNVPDAFYDFLLTGKDLTEFRQLRKNNGEQDDPKLDITDALHYYFYSIGTGSIGISTYHSITEEKLQLLKRFRNVFNLSYQRYTDIALAEAQAREAKIEAALEKIRSRSLAMHQSNELKEVMSVMFQRLTELDVLMGTVAIQVVDPVTKDCTFWIGNDKQDAAMVKLPYDEAIIGQDNYMRDFWQARNSGESFFNKLYSFEQKNTYFHYVFANNDEDTIPLHVRAFILNAPSHVNTLIVEKNSALFADNYNNQFYTDDKIEVLQRTAKVFDQAYVRFLDLQKAEAQVREAKIEAALERVRSRSMGMQKSGELKEIIQVVYDQFVYLHIPIEHAGFIMDYRERDDMYIWLTDSHAVPNQITIPYFDSPHWNSFNEAKSTGQDFFANHLSFEEKNKFYHDLFDFIPGMAEEVKQYYFSCPGVAISTVLLENVGLYIENFSAIPFTAEENNVLMRFGKVFQQTYTRFLDLQKAEAQTRESQVQLALERVRARTMAMQHSNELADASFVLDTQVRGLGIKTRGCAFNIYGDNESTEWFSSETGMMPTYKTPRENIFHRYVEEGKSGKQLYIQTFAGEACAAHYDYLCTLPVMGDALKKFKESGGSFPNQQVDHAVYFKYGYLLFITLEPVPEAHDIFKRFAKVFEQTYTRFLDLQKAEAQSREAQIQLGLERVRARTMSMYHSNELADTASVLFQQIKQLGFEMWSCGFCIWKENDLAEVWMNNDGGGLLPPMMIPYKEEPTHRKIYEASLREDTVHEYVWEGEALDKHYAFLQTIPSVRNAIEILKKSGLALPAKQCYYAGFFKYGYLLLISKEPDTAASDLTNRFAKVFDQTYTRFLDLQKAEALAVQAGEDLIKLQAEKKRAEDALRELRETQKQLIQSEKMASLGELTAGIAHEIQNPLNFVNNFSEVSNELVDEMNEELNKGDIEEAKAIAQDLKLNLEKINHHGKRADGIVKGMLQHSQRSSGVKEPTDINALADEYLRLAYHGLRAKDKSFNATLKTDFDETIGKVNIIPQDIGRVMLNLITNAFYATNGPPAPNGGGKAAPKPGFQPTVSVSTLKKENSVIITVRDNGVGIPQNIVDKIFQPFFTTKPTGQGTGLGLSLAYDIVKAHGGEIKVETEQEEGTIFTILLPITNS